MAKEIKIIVPAVPLGLNQLKTKNWRWGIVRKKQLQRKWYYLIKHYWDRRPIVKFKKAIIALRIFWRDARRIKDDDNLIGGCKSYIPDVLVDLGFLVDDDPEHLTWQGVYQFAFDVGQEERTEIILKEMRTGQ